MKRRVLVLAMGLVTILVLSSCGGTGTAVLRFANTAVDTQMGYGLRATQAPALFKMKLIAAYLSEDVNPVTLNNTGITSMFYLNPQCEDDIMHCDISAGTAEDGEPMSKIITDFFDLARPSAEVNAALNAQGRSIPAGSYKYVRVEFCKYNSGSSENIQWSVTGDPIESFKRDNCGVNSAEMNPPLTVAAGQTVTVTLSYDYSTAIVTGTGLSGYDDCNDAGTACFILPSFTPSASQ